MTVEITQLGTRELWEKLQEKPLEIYQDTARHMAEAGIEGAPTVSRVLEVISPSEKDDTLDAFGRLMREAGIRTRSDPQAGWWASTADEFGRNAGTRMLYHEFFAREWRKVSFAKPGERAILLSTDAVVGSWDRPYADATMARWDSMVAPAIPLAEVVSMTTPISGQDYRALYLEFSADNVRKFRVGESTDIPMGTLATSERTIRLKKYGRGIRATYEQLRRLRVDKLAWFIRFAAIQSEIDKVAAAMTVMINGDGNANTAPTTHDLTVLDTAAVAGTLTLKGWLAFKMKFVQPYILSTALMQEAVALQLALLNTGSANIPLVSANLGGLGTGLTPINVFADNVRFGWTAEAPTLTIVAFDRRFAIERVTEIGSDITEMERNINNQTQDLVMSEVEGYATLDPSAVKLLDVNA